MNKGLFAAAALIVSGAILAMNGSAKAAPPAPSWSGWYIGINGGGVWGRTHPTVADIGPDNFFAIGNVPAVLGNGSRPFHNSGGLAGGQIGYLTQIGWAVLGAELSVNWMGLDGSTSNGPTVYPVTAPAAFSWNLHAKSDFLATFLGRVGYDMGGWYPYFTGGLAVAHLKYTATYIDTFYPSVSTNSFEQSRVGFAIGGGVEWRFAAHWLVRGEYLYMTFDDVNGNGRIACTAGVAPCAAPANVTTFAFHERFNESVGRVAVSYQW